MRNAKSVVVTLAIMVPALLLGGGLALAADDAPGSRLADCSPACADACQADCVTRCEQQCASAADREQPATQLTDIECVGIGCWDPRMEPVVDAENQSSPNTTAEVCDTSDDGNPSTETGCVSCDVVLLNEYPEYRYR